MYYLLYADNSEMPSKVSFDPEQPSLGRIRGDSIAPPHSLASIKRCISRVEETPALANADFFADISSDAPLKEGYISIIGTDGPGLSMDEPMAIVQMPIVQVESPIPDGRYAIKNRAADFFWETRDVNRIMVVHFYSGTAQATNDNEQQVRNILQLFKCSKDNSLFRSGTSHMMLMVTSL